MTREIVAYQGLSIDDTIDATELHAEAIIRGSKPITSYKVHADMDSMLKLLKMDASNEFLVHSHDFFKCADASEHIWKYENTAIRFMSAIKDYFNKSGADNVYIHLR